LLSFSTEIEGLIQLLNSYASNIQKSSASRELYNPSEEEMSIYRLVF